MQINRTWSQILSKCSRRNSFKCLKLDTIPQPQLPLQSFQNHHVIQINGLSSPSSLPTIKAQIRLPIIINNHTSLETSPLLDSGAVINVISNEFVTAAGLPTHPIPIHHQFSVRGISGPT